jgi:1-acyl-sn-glycerol-3-phosphate acyltransferase
VAPSLGQRISTRVLPHLFRWMGWRSLGEVHAEGLDHVPPTGPVLLAARHYHHLFDAVVALRVFPRELHGIVGLDWVKTAGGRRFMELLAGYARWPVVLRKEMLAAGRHGPALNPGSAYDAAEIPVYLERAFRESVDLLCEGLAVGVFPEGWPNVDPHYTLKTGEEFLPFKSGFALIAGQAAERLGHPVPVLPVGYAYRPGPRWNAVMRFGAPVHAPHPEGARGLVAEVEEAVRKLCAPLRGPSGPGA